MKKLLKIFLSVMFFFIIGCEYDDSSLVERMGNLEERVAKLETLCNQMNTNISSLQTIVSSLQQNDYIHSVEPFIEGGDTVGYTISFMKSESIIIYHGQNGADGKDVEQGSVGKNENMPIIGVQQNTDGVYYWTLDGEWLLDEAGNKIRAVGTDGKNGVTPQLKIEGEYWFVSYDNAATWFQLGKITGEAVQNGDSFFRSVTQDEMNVYFTLANGTVITIKKGAALSIEFAEADLVVMSPNSTREISYIVSSVTDSVRIEVLSSADIKAKVMTDDERALTGKIHVETSATIDEYSRVVVLVSNGEKVVMRSITFEEAGLTVEENSTKQVKAEGGEITLEFLSNVECEVVIPEEAQSWIFVVPDTRAVEKQTVTLKLEPNTGYYRRTAITVQSTDGILKLKYNVEQDGDLEVDIDPTQIPDNEIWYVSVSNSLIELVEGVDFGASLVSHTYEQGKGVLLFDSPVTKIECGNGLMFSSENLQKLILPSQIKYVSDNPFLSHNLSEFGGKLASQDGKCLILDGEIVAFAPYGMEEYTTPSEATSIGAMAFYRNTCLKKIVISEGVKTIGHEAFFCDQSDDTKLEYVTLPSSLENLEYYIFARCKKIKKFEGDCKFISDDGYSLIIDNYNSLNKKYLVHFAVGAGLTDYTISEGVEGIENYCFYCAETLTSVTFPESVRDIGSVAFEGSYNIEKIYGKHALDDNRSYVVDNRLLFVADKGITEYTTPDCVEILGEHVFSDKQHLKAITLSDNVRSVEGYGYIFCHSPKLETITISARMSNMGYDPFGTANGRGSGAGKSESLRTIYMRSPVPPAITYNWSEQIPTLYDNLTIYLPEESYDTYVSSPKWNLWKKYFKPYDYGDLNEFYPNHYVSSDYSSDGVVATLQNAAKGNGVDIVLMGDAYSDRQIADGTYRSDMEYIYNNLFAEEPYKSFKDYFNVYCVNVVSATEGYDYGNTALDTYFGGNTLVGGNDNAVFDYALNALSEEEMNEALIVVVMNSDNYAGTCYMYDPENSSDYGSGVSVSYFPKGGNEVEFAQLLHHEACGHGFAKLADEYAYEDMGAVPSDYVSQIKSQQSSWGWFKNIDFTNNPSATRWSYFINDTRYANEGLGVYEGGLTYWSGVWRPTENSIMNTNTGGFNAPSREAIYYRIHKLAYGDSWEYDYEDFVEWDARNRTAVAAMARSKSYMPTNYRPTHPPVVVNKSWKDAR